MKTITFFLVLLGTIYAQDIKADEKLKLLCEEESSIGFNWENGSWSNAVFEPETYIVIKEDNSKCDINGIKPENQPQDQLITLKKGCYNIRRDDIEYKDYTNEICYEDYRKINGEFHLVFISCPKMGMEPNGRFMKASFNPSPYIVKDLRSKEDIKEPQTISHGKCRKL